jgi:HPr kinase/phosphorylase
MTPDGPTVHASAVLVDDRAVLIRGPSGSGKSRLVFDLIMAGQAQQVPEAMLIGDDRVHLEVRDGRLWVRPAPELAGLLEIRGLGIRRLDCATAGVVGLVVDLDAPDAARMPASKALQTSINGVELPRIPVGQGISALSLVVAALTTLEASVPVATFGRLPEGNW